METVKGGHASSPKLGQAAAVPLRLTGTRSPPWTLASSPTFEIGRSAPHNRHPRPRERPKGAESVGDPCRNVDRGAAVQTLLQFPTAIAAGGTSPGTIGIYRFEDSIATLRIARRGARSDRAPPRRLSASAGRASRTTACRAYRAVRAARRLPGMASGSAPRTARSGWSRRTLPRPAACRRASTG